jgi:hypothetical protein
MSFSTCSAVRAPFVMFHLSVETRERALVLMRFRLSRFSNISSDLGVSSFSICTVLWVVLLVCCYVGLFKLPGKVSNCKVFVFLFFLTSAHEMGRHSSKGT